jgi:TFIIF-interacting CTD phosphatase-like protein
MQKLPKYAKNISEVYTLVLDLDETLIHFEIDDDVDDDDGGYYNIRPGALRFLSVLSEFFEVVVFTAAMPDVSLIYLFLTFVFVHSMPIGS